MAGFRQIHTKIWKDPWFLDLESDHKLLFIYLFSNEQANMMGLYPIALKVISFETGLDQQTVKEALAQFTKDGKVEYQDNWIWIVKMFRYNANNPGSPKTQAHIRNTLEQVPDIPLKAKLIRHYSKMIPVAYPTHTPSIPVPQEHDHDHDQEQEQNKKRGGKTQPPTLTEHQAMFSALAQTYRINLETITQKQRGRLNTDSKRARDAGISVEQVQAAAHHWWTEDWRGKDRNSPPTTSQFFQTIEVFCAAKPKQLQEVESWQ